MIDSPVYAQKYARRPVPKHQIAVNIFMTQVVSCYGQFSNINAMTQMWSSRCYIKYISHMDCLHHPYPVYAVVHPAVLHCI